MSDERPLRIIWTWLDWWRIDHAAVRTINRVWTPIIGVLGALVIWSAPISLNIFGDGGILQQANGLIPVLAGFFVASLAAVATFSRPSLDDIMGGIAPSLRSAEQRKPERLTRRRFLCILFGYLAGSSIVVYLFGSCGMVVAPLFKNVPSSERLIARVIFSGIYLAAFAHVLLTSFLGLYYLIERIHQDPPEVGFLEIPPPLSPIEGDGKNSGADEAPTPRTGI